jgi:N-methylhydantoinase B
MAGTLDIKPGERLVSLTGGGGGYGSPLQRDPDLVARDVSEGWISVERARTVYGVAVRESPTDPGLFTPEPAETRSTRDRLMSTPPAGA